MPEVFGVGQLDATNLFESVWPGVFSSIREPLAAFLDPITAGIEAP